MWPAKSVQHRQIVMMKAIVVLSFEYGWLPGFIMGIPLCSVCILRFSPVWKTTPVLQRKYTTLSCINLLRSAYRSFRVFSRKTSAEIFKTGVFRWLQDYAKKTSVPEGNGLLPGRWFSVRSGRFRYSGSRIPTGVPVLCA
jgi:hypothetical protein